MLLSELPRVLRRRWWVAMLGLIATSGMLSGVTLSVPLEHKVTASVLLIPPAPSDAPPGYNPYLSLGGLTAPVEVLAAALSAEEAVAQTQASGGTADFTVARDYATAAPILLIESQDASASRAARTLDVVIAEVPGRLRALQEAAKVPLTSQITSAVVTRDVVGSTVRKPQIRALIGTLVVGVGMTLLLTALVDALVTGRRRSRDEKGGGQADDDVRSTDARYRRPHRSDDGRQRTPETSLTGAER